MVYIYCWGNVVFGIDYFGCKLGERGVYYNFGIFYIDIRFVKIKIFICLEWFLIDCFNLYFRFYCRNIDSCYE